MTAGEQRRPGRYPREFRDRTVRMVLEAESESGSQWEAICRVAEKTGPTAETVREVGASSRDRLRQAAWPFER